MTRADEQRPRAGEPKRAREPESEHRYPSSERTGVQTIAVTPDESGMRVDRFLEARFPGLSFSHIQRIIRKGELRVNGKRAQPKDRLAAGQSSAHTARHMSRSSGAMV